MKDDLTTIGGLIAALAPLDRDAEVYIDNRRPTALSSYRGYYDHLAIERSGAEHPSTERDEPGRPFELNGYGTYEPGIFEVRIKHPATVGELVKALELAEGATFEGYKGGQFYMDSGSELWVSEHGEYSGLRVVGVEALPGRVDLVTKELPW